MLVLTAPAAPLAAQTASYLNHDALTRELRSLVNGSNLAALRSLGRSHGGRDVWLVEIADRAGPALDTRPGVLVVGNLEGDHLVGSALALETVRFLLSGSGGDTALAGLLRREVFYLIPRLNPDGAEAYFAPVRTDRRGNARPFDDDNDGRTDEDPPEDLNGDGLITLMRVRDPAGDYMIDTADARLMKHADPSKRESGAYTLYWEGVDSDGDGFLNEDGPGGVDLNRNFQHAYAYWQRDVGPNMVSEAESRALMDFMIAHGNIATVLTFGLSDNLVTAPDSRGESAAAQVLDLPRFAAASNAEIFEKGIVRAGAPGGFGGFGGGGFFFGGGGGGQPRLRGAQAGADNDPNSGRRPATTVNRDDIQYFEAVSKAYREVTGIEKVGVNRAAEGAFFQYGYFQFGVPSFSTPGWALPQKARSDSAAGEAAERPAQEPADTAAEAPRRQGPPAGGRGPGGPTPRGRPGGAPAGAGGGSAATGFDRSLLSAFDSAGIDAFVNWTPFAHPALGAVEIGGFRPYAIVNPPEAQVTELGRKHGEFVVRLARMLPRVRIARTEVTSHGGGVFTVTAEVENAGYLPTSLQHGVVSEAVQPTTVQIQVEPDQILTGAAKTSTIQKLDGSGAREKFTWVIRGRQGASVEIRVRSQKGGSDSATVTLR
jgi:hypothetical protein